ncbi:MAG: hypothetical protein JO348_08325 [Alphaproteobacteria bacterium]|nr:hypothetical protein [Alphaproteobacteria bacterium]MBV9419764.1 hypothetical protein [Alphaproteobacteria bacterium]
MTFNTVLARFLVVAVLSLGAVASAQAQTPPEKFHSPFNGDLEPGSGEAQDFGKLLDLYDAMLDAQAALAAAEKCGGDTKKAKENLDKATAAFNEAFDEYVIGWDMGTYSMTLTDYHRTVKDHTQPYMKGKKAQKTLDALKAADKKKHDAAACPPPPATDGKLEGGGAKPDEKKPPEKFHSPFNGDLANDSSEAQDFARLLDLYDAMLDAQAALTAAEKCGGDTKAAKAALDKATAAFNEAFDEYVIGWDMGTGSITLNAYHERVKDHSKPYMVGGKADKTLDALKAADKKKHDAGACPPPATTPGGDVAPEHSSLPRCDDGSDQLADRIAKDEDDLASMEADEASADPVKLAALHDREAPVREELAALSSLKACPSDYHPPKESGDSIFNHISIGVGVGVGGGHRGRDDRGHDDKPAPRTHCEAVTVRRFA